MPTTKKPQRPAPKTMPHAFGFRPGIDLDKLNQVADELEAEWERLRALPMDRLSAEISRV